MFTYFHYFYLFLFLLILFNFIYFYLCACNVRFIFLFLHTPLSGGPPSEWNKNGDVPGVGEMSSGDGITLRKIVSGGRRTLREISIGELPTYFRGDAGAKNWTSHKRNRKKSVFW